MNGLTGAEEASLFLDIDAGTPRRTIAGVQGTAWQLPWVRLHLYARELLTVRPILLTGLKLEKLLSDAPSFGT